MKVNVIQVSEATFQHRFSWRSHWIDIAVYDFASSPYLLQMRVSRRNRKSFRSICMTDRFAYKSASIREIGDLTPMQSAKP